MTKFSFRICAVLQVLLFMLLFCILPVSAQKIGNAYLAPAKNNSEIILMAIFGLVAIVSIVLFILFGKDKKVNPTDVISPPDEITSAEASFILGRNIKSVDITALIVYWANKGYLSINNISEAGTDELEFEKLKDSDAGMKPYEKSIFDKLFNGRSTVALAELKGSFNINPIRVTVELAHSFRTPSTRFFTRAGNITAIIFGIMAGLCTGGMAVFTAIAHNYDNQIGTIYSIAVFIITICLCALLRFFGDKTAYGKKFGTCIVIYIAVLLVMTYFSFSTIPAVISSVSAAVCGIVAALSKKHTKRGRELLGKLLGLKQFITTDEKDRIDILVKENPTLFYDVLPFAFALGVAEEWTMQFENIAVAKPSWYKSSTPGVFNPAYFTNFISSMGNNPSGKNAFAIGAFAVNRGFQSGSRTRIP